MKISGNTLSMPLRLIWSFKSEIIVVGFASRLFEKIIIILISSLKVIDMQTVELF